LSQDGKRPMIEGRDEQVDSSFALKAYGNPDPAQPGADLKKEEDEIRNPKDQNDGNSANFHFRLPFS